MSKNTRATMEYTIADNISDEDRDPITPIYETQMRPPKSDLSATPLAGKYIRYSYETFWEVNKDKGVKGTPSDFGHDLFFYENGECEWFAQGYFDGDHARMPCGTVEIAPNIYMVSWREPDRVEYVVQVINLNTWTVNSTFMFDDGKGLLMFEGFIESFGDIPDPPITVSKR